MWCERPQFYIILHQLFRRQVYYPDWIFCFSPIDGKDDCGLGEKTVLPWILLYHLIKHDEKSMDEFEDDVPCSVNFLCSAHDYLGPLSLCTLGSGKVLTLLVDGMLKYEIFHLTVLLLVPTQSNVSFYKNQKMSSIFIFLLLIRYCRYPF